jgi:hypothetical protein
MTNIPLWGVILATATVFVGLVFAGIAVHYYRIAAENGCVISDLTLIKTITELLDIVSSPAVGLGRRMAVIHALNHICVSSLNPMSGELTYHGEVAVPMILCAYHKFCEEDGTGARMTPEIKVKLRATLDDQKMQQVMQTHHCV